ncbi:MULTISPECIES: TonB-dependent siderophore receptor [Pseudomonas]|uniref:TonB-dependent siderophore receptor n=1 Tax=Pseudomonas TaxID=286 RepID=UPI000C889D77|nr:MULTISPECIES: TonB-dependent siderophore receptor [Pseudomonas]MDR6577276.1 iron complex outermembrane receptor protein [Pseudomonas extremaustralis]PMX13707.1 TonB-dependent siderophore receptor [Pseudomonas sp. GW460-12]PMX28735.1 TonB-dependent siderophore receptor [Pseudomonas sp. MPR-R2A4]PMX32306.1 TonB-dependent siderophore receptor [Pseudomonas sp. MPR-R2A7]PMX46543.1 TonB-dependent siderophore receptor [Pseudomonas sp. MPR-R2A6]
MSRLARPLHPLALSVAIAFAAVPLLIVPSAFAEESRSALRRFQIPAGELSQALNSLAEQAGLVLAFDASLARGKRSNGLSGQYDTEVALNHVLAGSGLQALKISADRYRLEAIPDNGGAMELQATTISAADRADSPTGPVAGYVATRSLSGTKTDTAVIETPQSISIVTKDQMRAQNAESLNQILRYSAAVVPETRGATASRLDQLTIRGFAPSTYLDGLRVPSSRDALPQKDAFDLERVEVLRGPASVLYGQGTPSGVINMVTKRPLDTPFHEVGVEYGTFNKKRTTFDLSGPIDDQGVYAYRVAGLFDEADGQVEHTETRRQSLSSAFTWRPDEATSLTLLGHFQKDPQGASYGSVPAWGSVLHSPTGRKIDVDFYDGEKNFEKSDREYYSLGYAFEHHVDDVWTVRQNARYLRAEGVYRSLYNSYLRADYRTSKRSTIATDVDMDAYNLDNQLQAKFDTGPLQHTLLMGLDYQNTSTDTKAGYGSGPDLDIFDPVYGAPVATPAFTTDATSRSEQTGVYLQEQMKWDQWVLLLGGRYDWASTDSTTKTLSSGAKSKSSLDSKAFTGRVGLVYLFENGLAPYASYAESFNPQSGTGYGGSVFKPTEGKQYEIGIKYQPPGSNSFITAAIFDLRQSNVPTIDPDPTHLCGNGRCNIQDGEQQSRGFELEGKASLNDNLDITAAYAYLDNRASKSNSTAQYAPVSDVGVGPAIPVKGTTTYGLPRHTASAWADYTFHDGQLKGFGAGAGARYVGSSWGDTANTLKVPGYTLFDAAVHYDIANIANPKDNLRLALNATNLANKEYVASCLSYSWCWYGSQRTVQASATYRW